MRGFFRALGRALHLGGYLLAGLWRIRGLDRRSEAERLEFVRAWLARATEILGVKVTVRGLDRLTADEAQGALWLPNHVSWLDIPVIGGLVPGTVFLSKSELASWPVIGRLARLAGTQFIQRGRGSAAAAEAVARGVSTGHRMVVFAEGTTTDGTRVRRFHARLLGPAVETGCPVVPVALRYFDADGRRTTQPAFTGQESLWPSMWRVLRSRQVEAVVDILSPLHPHPDEPRSDLARRAHHAVASVVV